MHLHFSPIRSAFVRCLALGLLAPSLLVSGVHASSGEPSSSAQISATPSSGPQGYGLLMASPPPAIPTPPPAVVATEPPSTNLAPEPVPILPPVTALPAPSLPAFAAPSPTASPSPQAPAALAPAPKPALLRWGYMVGTTLPAAVLQHPEDFDVLSPDWFHLDDQGNIYTDYNSIPHSVVQFLKAHNIKLVPIVANGEFDAGVAHDMLIDGHLQTHVLDSLQALLNTSDYAGINIDFENLYPSDRQNFSAFMSNVYARLHPLGKEVTLALPSKTDEDPTGFAAAFDYAALAPHMDMAVIMTYDDHYAGGPAGPVAPLSWVNDVINYATQFIPSNKLLLGLPFYGYNWDVSWGGWGSAMGYHDIVSTVFAHGGTVHMDAASETPYYSYDDANGSHQIWFENSTSLGYKIALAQSHNLAGWGAWRIGLEDQNFWNLNLTGNN